VFSVHSAVLSVQLVLCGRRVVAMVRRRSTVRFRKGTPGREEYSNIYPVTFGPSGVHSGALFDE